MWPQKISSKRDVHYSCGSCGYSLNLSSSNRLISSSKNPKWKRKAVLSFLGIDESRFLIAEEFKCRPYFEAPGEWGFCRNRSKLLCRKCGAKIGYIAHKLVADSLWEQSSDSSDQPDHRKICVNIKALQPEQESPETGHTLRIEDDKTRLKVSGSLEM